MYYLGFFCFYLIKSFFTIEYFVGLWTFFHPSSLCCVSTDEEWKKTTAHSSTRLSSCKFSSLIRRLELIDCFGSPFTSREKYVHPSRATLKRSEFTSSTHLNRRDLLHLPLSLPNLKPHPSENPYNSRNCRANAFEPHWLKDPTAPFQRERKQYYERTACSDSPQTVITSTLWCHAVFHLTVVFGNEISLRSLR